MGHQAALAADETHDVLLGIPAGVAHGHQRLKANAAHALRGEHPLVVTDAVHHLAADKQPGGAAAAQVQHDQAAVGQGLVQYLLGAAQGHGAAVEGVADHGAGQVGVAGDAGLVCHLVHGNGVTDKGGDAQGLGKAQCQHAAQVGGVSRVVEGVHIVHHVLIHLIGAGGAEGQLAAPGADGVQRGQIHLVGGQFLFDGGLAEVRLVHDPGEGLQLLPAVAHGGIKELFLAAEQRELGGGGTGVDHKNTTTHSQYSPKKGAPSL